MVESRLTESESIARKTKSGLAGVVRPARDRVARGVPQVQEKKRLQMILQGEPGETERGKPAKKKRALRRHKNGMSGKRALRRPANQAANFRRARGMRRSRSRAACTCMREPASATWRRA